VEINIIEEEQSSWLAFQNGELDILYLRPQFSPVAIPDNKVNPQLAAKGVRLNRITDPEVTYHYFNLRDPIVGGYSKEKIALRRAIFMAYDNQEEINIIRKGQAVEAHFPVPPGVVGHQPRYRVADGRNVELANALLDRFGYRTGPDGWRTLPDGRPLLIRFGSQPDSIYRQFDELWKKTFDSIHIRMEVQKEKFAELLKLEKQCRLMMRGAAWIADYPDGDDFMMLLYGPNVGQSNNACFEVKEFDELYERSTKMPPSPERDKLYVDMARLGEYYGAWKMNNTRYRNMLVYPRVKGYKKHPILLADWMYLDIEK
jgi:ABC-type transport system substrate-binding protein